MRKALWKGEKIGRSPLSGRDTTHPWVARITGLSAEYEYHRQFLRAKQDWTQANHSGSRGVFFVFTLAQDAPRLALPARVGATLAGFDQDRGKSRDHASVSGTITGLDDVLLDNGHRQTRLDEVAGFEDAARALGKACKVAAKQMSMKEWPGHPDLILNFWWAAGQPSADRQSAKELALGLWDQQHHGISDQRKMSAAADGRQVLERLPEPELAATGATVAEHLEEVEA